MSWLSRWQRLFLNGAGSTIWNALAALWPTLAGCPPTLTIWRGKDLVGAAPLYLKGHSYGEFVFDHQWADLAERLGGALLPQAVGHVALYSGGGVSVSNCPPAKMRWR